MKTFEDFIKAKNTDEELSAKIKAALDTLEVKNEQECIAAIVKVAQENGYDVSVEDYSLQKASFQELDKSELDLLSGGGRGKNEGDCAFDYMCTVAFNSCDFTNECFMLRSCNESLY